MIALRNIATLLAIAMALMAAPSLAQETQLLFGPDFDHQVYDALALGMDPRDTGFATTLQERAWSTPIWYTP